MSFPHPLLTKLPRGYIAWRGRCVEHFSFRDPVEEQDAARDLANHCEMLEAKGFPVTDRTCRSRALYEQAPAGTPWLNAMTSFYAIFADSSGRATRCILRLADNAAVAVGMENAQLVMEYGYETEKALGTVNLFYALQDEGLSSIGADNCNYEPLVALFTQVGLTPQLVDAVLATPAPEGLEGPNTESPTHPSC